MNNIAKTIIVSQLLACINSISAQEKHETPMTLRECMEYAVSNSTKMRIESANRNDEQWQRRHALMSLFTPSVDAQTYAYNQYGRNLDPETNTYNTITTFHNGYSVSAGITLFDGFQSVNNLKMASTAAKMGISREQQTRDEICLATMEAFYNVIYYTELQSVLESQVATAEKARDKAVRQEELGQKGHADVIQMESELAQKQYQLITTRNMRNDAMITLKDVMFWPVGDELMIDNNVAEPTLTPVFLSEISSSAKLNLPDAEMALMTKKRAALDLKSARGAYSPTLGLYAGWSTTYYTYPGMKDYSPASFGEQWRNNRGEYVQLALSIPIFDQLRRRTTLKTKKNALVRAEAEYDQKMRDIENEVARAVSDRDGAQAAFTQAEKLANVQQEAFRLSTKQFENGLISAIEFQTASQNYLHAMAERINNLLKLRIKDSLVRYYSGESYLSQL